MNILFFTLFVSAVATPLFEGDLKVTYTQVADAYGVEYAKKTFDGSTDIMNANPTRKWPNGDVPYHVDMAFYDTTSEQLIDDVMDSMTEKLGPFIKFRRNVTSDVNHIVFKADKVVGGCWSYLGMIGGPQTINFGCLTGNMVNSMTIEHEVLHALGFWHEQSRSDRDDYIKIFLENVMDGYEAQFEKRQGETSGTEYDYKSVMHYANTAFSKNGLNVMESTNPEGVVLGNWVKMTQTDIIEAKRFYGDDTTMAPTNGPTPKPTSMPSIKPTMSPTTYCERFNKRHRKCKNHRKRCFWKNGKCLSVG